MYRSGRWTGLPIDSSRRPFAGRPAFFAALLAAVAVRVVFTEAFRRSAEPAPAQAPTMPVQRQASIATG